MTKKLSLKERYKRYKSHVKLSRYLEDTLVRFDCGMCSDDPGLSAFYSLENDEADRIISELMNVKDYAEFCDCVRVEKGFAVDQCFDLIYDQDLSFKKFKKEIQLIKSQVLLEQQKRSGYED